jgi:hypothetical protein
MGHSKNLKKTITQKSGFNLIEVLLAITFFSLAFSGMLLGSTAMINTSTNGTKVNEDNAVTGALFMGVNPQSAYMEASATQLTAAIASPTSVVANPAGDITIRRTQIIPDNTPTVTTDNRRFYFERLVYSNLETPDVKTAQIDFYSQPTGGTPIKSTVRKMDKREECFAMGVTGSLFLPSFGQPCTGWSYGFDVPKARAMVLTGAGGTQNFKADFRLNGASSSLVTGNQLSQWPTVIPATPPVEPTDRGHQVASGTTAEYWVEATPNVAYNLIVGLRKTANTQSYTVSVNTDPTFLAQPIPPINCEATVAPRNCQRKSYTFNTSNLDVANGQPFSVKFSNIMPYSIGTIRTFRIKVLSTGVGSPPAVIHFIKKELARNLPTT